MADDCVALTDKAQHEFELRTVHILTRSFIEEHPVNLYAFELAIFVLVEGAHPHVADELAFFSSSATDPLLLGCREVLNVALGLITACIGCIVKQ